MSERVFVRYPLTAVGCRGYFAIGVYLSPIATACGEYNYPAPTAQVCRLGLPFKQSSFIPHSQRFTLPFSSGSIVSQLTTLPICYTPHWVSPPDKSVGDRVICTSLRNTFSYCRATGRIPNGPRAALAYAAALPGAQYNFNMLSQKYQAEQQELARKIETLQTALAAQQQSAADAEKWVHLVKQYTNPTELTAELLNALIEKVLVHEAVKNPDGTKDQEIEIYYRFIGKVE